MNFILTSCGLSILTNYLREFNIFPNEIYKYSNVTQDEIDKNFLKKIKIAIDDLKEKILTFNDEKLKKLSAELNALVTFYNGNFNKNDFHMLLHTDTYLGKLSAEVLEVFLKSKGLQVNKFLAKDLKTSSLEEFQIALSEVVKDLSEVLEGYKASGYEIVFNLTGGFKGVNAFLQTMASLYADKSIYIFETGNELLNIPRLPITIDMEFFEKNYDILRKLELGIYDKEIEKLPQSIVMKIGDEYTLSPWGEMVWQKFKNEYYKTNLKKLVIDNIVYSNEFIKDVEKLNPSEKLQLNRNLEKLEDYKINNINSKSLNYHSLSGDISHKYSHEFYPFDGNDSRRCFCNESDGKIIIEKIGPHLK